MQSQPRRLRGQRRPRCRRQSRRCRRRNRRCRCPVWARKSARSASIPIRTGAGGRRLALAQPRQLRRGAAGERGRGRRRSRDGASVDHSRPIGIRAVLRSRRPGAARSARQRDPIERGPAVGPGALEQQFAAARRPARAPRRPGRWSAGCSPLPSGLITPMRSPAPGTRRVKAIHSPSGLHSGARVPAAAEADPALAGAVGVHHVELLRARAVAFEHDPARHRARSSASVSMPGAVVSRWGSAAARRRRHRCRCWRPACIENSDALAVGRIARGEGHRVASATSGRCCPQSRSTTRIVRLAADEADVGDRCAPLGERRGVSTIESPAVTIALVAAVAVHHRDALDPRRPVAAFGDIGDAGVEHARRARSRRCRRAPEHLCAARRQSPAADDEALAAELAALGRRHRRSSRRSAGRRGVARTKPVSSDFAPWRPPFGEGRRGHFGVGIIILLVGRDRHQLGGRAQVGGDQLRSPARRSRAGCPGRARSVSGVVSGGTATTVAGVLADGGRREQSRG